MAEQAGKTSIEIERFYELQTNRLLMNLILMRAGFPPVIIRRADRFSFHLNTYLITPGNYNFNREVYYKHLQTANEGDIRPFIRLDFFHLPKSIQHDSCVQVHSVVYGENVGGVPVGQPGVHHGGGGGRVD